MVQVMKMIITDGGRSKYFKADGVGDCVTRAITIASRGDYKEVYDEIRRVTGESPRNGVTVSGTSFKKYMVSKGFVWHACMGIGTGCTVHMVESELPKGRLVCSLSGHWAAVIDGVLHDTFDCTRGGSRCVYGYWEYVGSK